MSDKIIQIRTMIQTPGSEYIFPKKKHTIKLIDSEYVNVSEWEKYPDDFIKNILEPLTKLNLRFDSFCSFRDWVLTPGSLELMNHRFLTSLYILLSRVQTSAFSANQLAEVRALLNYERKPWFRGEPVENSQGIQLNTISVETRIQRLLNKQEPLKKEKIFWRGQRNSEIIPISWFSVSANKSTAEEYGNVLFKIHVQPNTRVINLYEQYAKYGIKNPVKEISKVRAYMQDNNYITPYSLNYSNHTEYVIEGGGFFYKDINRISPGFKEVFSLSCLSNTTCPKYYETYYFPPESPLPEKQWKRNMYPTNGETKTLKTRKNYRNLNARMRNYTRINKKKNIQYPT